MKKNLLFAAVLLVAGVSVFTSCKKEEGQIFRLTIANPDKTSLGANHETQWQEGDVIYINGDNTLTVNVSNNYCYAAGEQTIDPVNDKFYAFYGGRATSVTNSITADAQSYSFTMPSSYTYSSTDLLSPMAGVGNNSNGNVTVVFNNLFTMLEFDVPIANASSPYTITITEKDQVNNMPLAGNFTTSYENNQWVTRCTGDASYSLEITKNTTETRVSIPIPAGNHKLDIWINAAYKATMNGDSYNFQAGVYYPIKTLVDLPQEIIPWPFPGGGDSVFFFGKGNLCYHEWETPNWRLEHNQWDTTNYVTTTNHTQTSQVVWQISSTINPTSLNNGGTVTGAALNHSYAVLVDPNIAHLDKWMLPTRSHWSIVLGIGNPTPNWAYAKISYTKTIGNQTQNLTQNGLLIVPPGTDLTGTNIQLGHIYATGTTVSASTWNDVPTLTSADFEALEKHGVIFLPAFGFVEFKGNAGTWKNDYCGYYRTADPVNAGGTGAWTYVLKFAPNDVPSTSATIKFGEGGAVRLLYVETTGHTSK